MMKSVDYSDDERDADDFNYFLGQNIFNVFLENKFRNDEKDKKIEKKEETGRE